MTGTVDGGIPVVPVTAAPGLHTIATGVLAVRRLPAPPVTGPSASVTIVRGLPLIVTV